MNADVVIPTLGRPSLGGLLEALARQLPGPRPARVIVVDDRRGEQPPPLGSLLPPGIADRLAAPLELLSSPGEGPAAARNAGWRRSEADWVAFLDDDVVPAADWCRALAADLRGLSLDIAGSQGRIRVPLARDRPPTDWERNVAGLEDALWATADMAYRRSILIELDGFDERFSGAYREDCDLGLRVTSLGMTIERGRREVEHPPGPATFWRSVALQRGNADDALMRSLHGRRWRERGGAPRGRLRRHLLFTAGAVLAMASAVASRPRLARLAALVPAIGFAELARARIMPGPRDRAEVVRMLATSLVLPFAAVAQRLRGELRWRAGGRTTGSPPEAVLFDRDGTLIHDVPYNGDPEAVAPMPLAREALDALRSAGVPIAVISNQAGVARGLIGEEDVHAVNRRVEELLGPVAVWVHCPHGPDDGCGCRKPAPGLVLRAAGLLGVEPSRCAIVGDIASDLGAASAAGARGILVPTPETRREEVAGATEVAPDLLAAVRRLVGAPR
ncbi:MAG: HAD-superfamily hydrolase subfamily [Solirubrobacterales bacterium]|nr:HAD-superfamily hydrolase subfamily [Solirubrobacterales bacterium]